MFDFRRYRIVALIWWNYQMNDSEGRGRVWDRKGKLIDKVTKTLIDWGGWDMLLMLNYRPNWHITSWNGSRLEKTTDMEYKIWYHQFMKPRTIGLSSFRMYRLVCMIINYGSSWLPWLTIQRICTVATINYLLHFQISVISRVSTFGLICFVWTMFRAFRFILGLKFSSSSFAFINFLLRYVERCSISWAIYDWLLVLWEYFNEVNTND